MPSLGRAGVGRVGGNCQQLQEGSLFIVSSRDQRLRQAGPPDHTRLTADWLLLRGCLKGRVSTRND